jgi:hypothetical protein
MLADGGHGGSSVAGHSISSSRSLVPPLTEPSTCVTPTIRAGNTPQKYHYSCIFLPTPVVVLKTLSSKAETPSPTPLTTPGE